MAKVYSHIGTEHLRTAMAKRPSVAGTMRAVAERTNGNGGATPVATTDPGASLDRMDNDQLERLKAAIQERLEKVEVR